MKTLLRNILFITIIGVHIKCAEDESQGGNFPGVETLPVSEITTSGATFNAEITFRSDDEIISYGFVWGESENPLFDSDERFVYTGNIQANSFSAVIGSTLNESISYYVRAFIQTDDFLVYGENVQFTAIGGIAPELLSISPKEAFRSDTLSIEGTGFSYQENLVYFDEYIGQILTNTDSLIKVLVPQELTSLQPIIKIIVAGRSDQIIDQFKLLGPTLSRISHNQGVIGRDVISLESNNITIESDDYSVEIDGIEYDIEITSLTEGSISFYIPPSSPVGEHSINLIKDSERFINPFLFDFITPWVQKTDFPGTTAGPHGFSFTINDRMYLSNGTGYTSNNDFWEYDPTTDAWHQKRNIPQSVNMRFAFSANGKGYIGGGCTCQSNVVNTGTTRQKVFSYDPNTDSWRGLSLIIPEKSVDRGIAGALAFSVNNVGYMFGGSGTLTNAYNYWKYDDINDSWSIINEFNGFRDFFFLLNPSGFVINEKIYLGLGNTSGRESAAVYTSSFWEYDPKNDTWKQLSDFPGISRNGAVGFAKNGKGYIGLGYNYNHGTFKDFWSYDPNSDQWRRIADFPSSPREGAVSAELNNRAFVGLGSQRNDFWEFELDE